MTASALLASFTVAFTAVFVVVEPIGVAPLFATLTAGRPAKEVRAMALRATLVGTGILVAFTLFGGPLLGVLRVHLDAFRTAGGLLLLLTGLDMLRGKAPACRCSPEEMAAAGHGQDVAIVPIAVPLLAGPGAMATVMVLAAEGGAIQTGVVLTAVGLTFLISYAVLRAARWIDRFMTPSIAGVVERVLGLLLSAVAVQFVATGVLGLLAAG